MSQALHGVTDPTFEEIRSMVCSTVHSIKQRITPKICSHFNSVALRLEQVIDWCNRNPEIEHWDRPLPTSMKGLTIYEQGTFIVVCNAKEKDPLVRVKIILHEVGHYLLHRRFLESGIIIRAGGEFFADNVEKEANLFALMAMVPDREVRAICSEYEGFEDCIPRLQRSFMFTREEAVVRLAAFDGKLRRSSYPEMFDRFIGDHGGS